jgi:hypothetical protein
MTFKVVASQQAIVLNVFDIITKAGFPIKMEPPFALGTLSTSNTYGAPRFYSYDLPAVLGLDGTTGAISGSVTTAQNLDFDLFVTDDTNRVTSQPVAVSVLPNLRLTVASTLTTQQGATAKTPILTDYALGNVAYEKGSGNWPTGLDVNPTTGALTGKVTGVGGTYAGLTIRGRDTFGGYVDTQESNAFTVTVTSTNAKPVFANVPSNKLVYGRVGTATTWKPTINDNSNKVWAYGGLTVTANYDLTQYGLTLDPDTGEISGTPTKSVIIPDLKLTVVAGNGYSDDITPFWFGIAPEKPLAFAASAPTKFIFRSKTAINQNAIPITDAVGASTFTVVGTPGGITLDKNTGALDYTGATALSTTTSKTLTITVKDDFGQTASYQPTMAVNAALTLTYAAFNAEAGSDILPQTGTVGGQLGTLSYSQATTFAGLSVNATTGALTGKLQESDFTDGFATIQVKVTDAQDNASVTASMVVTQVARHRYWKYTWTFGAATTGNFRALTFFDEKGVNSALSRVNAGTATVSGTIVSGTKTLTDILAGTGSNNISTATGVMVDFGTQDVPLVIKWRYNQIETGLAFQRGTIYLSYSDDGANWTIAGTAVTTGATLAYASNLAVKSK